MQSIGGFCFVVFLLCKKKKKSSFVIVPMRKPILILTVGKSYLRMLCQALSGYKIPLVSMGFYNQNKFLPLALWYILAAVNRNEKGNTEYWNKIIYI